MRTEIDQVKASLVDFNSPKGPVLTGRAVTHPKTCAEDCVRFDLFAMCKAGVLDLGSPAGTVWTVTTPHGYHHIEHRVTVERDCKSSK